MKALKEFALNGQLYAVGDEVPEDLVTDSMVKSGKVQEDNVEQVILTEKPSPVEVSTETVDDGLVDDPNIVED